MQLTKTAKGKPLICLTVSRSLVPFLDEDKENFAPTVKETNPGLFSPYNDAENFINNNSMINERQTDW